MDWYEITDEYHSRTFKDGCRLSSLPVAWQRELAALWRLEADVNNGFYLQFLVNWGRESYVYASQALRKIGAVKMVQMIDRCQALVDQHFSSDEVSPAQRRQLLTNPVMDSRGLVVKEAGSVLPDALVDQINELSSDFVDYPEDIATLGLAYYRPYVEAAQDA